MYYRYYGFILKLVEALLGDYANTWFLSDTTFCKFRLTYHRCK